jgi:hypothetical protein
MLELECRIQFRLEFDVKFDVEIILGLALGLGLVLGLGILLLVSCEEVMLGQESCVEAILGLVSGGKIKLDLDSLVLDLDLDLDHRSPIRVGVRLALGSNIWCIYNTGSGPWYPGSRTITY